MVVALLYEMQAPCNCFTLSLCVSDSCRSNSWRDDNDATMKIKVSSQWRWNHDDALEMEIKGTRWWWPYHVTYFDCMWCLSFIHLILLSTMVALWDDPLLKFQGISVLPEYAPLRKFFVLRHHVMIGCDRLYVQIQRVQNSSTRGILRLNLTSLAYNRYGLGTQRPKGRAWII